MSTILGCECHEVNGQHAAWCPAHPNNTDKQPATPTQAAAPGPREQGRGLEPFSVEEVETLLRPRFGVSSMTGESDVAWLAEQLTKLMSLHLAAARASVPDTQARALAKGVREIHLKTVADVLLYLRPGDDEDSIFQRQAAEAHINELQYLALAAEGLRQRLEGVAEYKKALDVPELEDFAKGVVIEAQHQRQRWGDEHDTTKEAEEWFWVVGYLAGKGLQAQRSGDMEKFKHHLITGAAVLANWHARAKAALQRQLAATQPGVET